MKGFLVDCRHAFRLYARTPVASSIAIFGLAIAMAAVAAFVSLYVDLLLRPHGGFENSNRLLTIKWTDGRQVGGLPQESIGMIAGESITLEAVAGTARIVLRAGPDSEPLQGEMVTQEFFSGIRPRLALGRGFEIGEHRGDGEPVVVISHAYWQQQFDGRRDVLGKTISLEASGSANIGTTEAQGAIEFQIIGVMNERVISTARSSNQAAYWLPVERALALVGSDFNAMNAAASMHVLGLRSPDATRQAVTNELNGRFVDEIGANVEGLTNVRYDSIPGLVFDIAVQRSTQQQIQVYLGASILLALVAAANVSLFLLTRAPGRQRELGIRMSVGATLGRVARQVASEAAALVILAAMLGLVFSIWLGEFLLTLSFLRDAQWNDVRLLDWRVMGLVGAFILVISTIISLAPIVGLVRGGIAASSRQISASPSFSQSVAGATQIAIACTLGAAAFAYSWYLGALFFGDPGYVTRDLYAISYAIPLRVEEGAIVGMSATDKARRREIIVSLPGVSDVSFSSMVPGMQVVGGQFEARHPDNPSRRLLVRRAIIDANYVGMLQLDLLYGRSPTKTDVGVALVNQTLAHELWGRVNVVGETFPALNSNSADVPIIGVLADLSYGHPDATVEPMAFTTDGIQSIRDIAIISSSLSLAELQQGLQGLIDTGALELSIVESTSLNALRGDLIASDRARSALTAGASILVVSLAGVGFYGTQRYLVTLGRREYAIRAALGAGPRALGRLVLWRGCMLGIPGLVFGLPLAFFVVAWLHDNHLSRVISPFLMTLAAASSLAVLMMFASWGPARQARITQPAPLLKEI